jgi:arylsulfatase A
LERRDFLRLVAAGGAAAVVPSSFFLASCANRGHRPNVVLFLADDLGYGDLGCYGNPINQTPNLDKLASEGMRFTDCHAAGTVCSPSRAGLLTGRHPYRSGIYYLLGGGAHLRREEITIASLLKRAGYDTCFVGKWHLSRLDNPDEGQPTPGDHGFDHWFATTENAFEGPENPQKFIRNGERVGPVKGWYCDVIVEEASSWLRSRTGATRPFFLLVCSHEPHTPIAPPANYAEMYDNDKVDRLERTVGYGGVPRDKEGIGPNKKYYYGTVSQLDNAFGNLMGKLDSLGLRNDTLVLFTSDNGPEYPVNQLESKGEWDDPIRDRCFGTPGPLRGMKRFTTEGGHRVPAIARWPGHIRAGTTNGGLVNGTDILPTLCELAGVKPPADRTIDGESVAGALRGKKIIRKKPVCWNFPTHEYSFIPPMVLRDGPYSLVAYFNAKDPAQTWMDWIKTARPERFELYDLSRDIGQREDLSGGLPEKTVELADKLRAAWKDIQADAPVWPRWKTY